MTTSAKNIIKEYQDGGWPGASVFLMEQAGYLDLFTSTDDGTTYRVYRVSTVVEADQVSFAFFREMDGGRCPYCQRPMGDDVCVCQSHFLRP